MCKITPSIKECLKEQPQRSGSYQWIFAHQGDLMEYTPDFDPEQYDIVQVNGAPIDFPIIYNLRKKLGKDSDTKLVVNNDYVSEAWEDRKIMPALWHQAFDQADMLFGTEPAQTSMLSERAFCMPHPTNTKMLKHFRSIKKGQSHNLPWVGSIFHWWVGNVWNSYNVTKDLPCWSQLLAYVRDNDKFMYTKQLFNELVPPKNYPDYSEHLMKCKAVLDLCPYHTYGRNSVDLACFEVPHIVSNRIYSGQKLWNGLAVDPYDIRGARNLLKDVLADKEYIRDITSEAYDKAEYFGHKQSLNRYNTAMEMVNSGKEMSGWLWDDKENTFVNARRGF